MFMSRSKKALEGPPCGKTGNLHQNIIDQDLITPKFLEREGHGHGFWKAPCLQMSFPLKVYRVKKSESKVQDECIFVCEFNRLCDFIWKVEGQRHSRQLGKVRGGRVCQAASSSHSRVVSPHRRPADTPHTQVRRRPCKARAQPPFNKQRPRGKRWTQAPPHNHRKIYSRLKSRGGQAPWRQLRTLAWPQGGEAFQCHG